MTINNKVYIALGSNMGDRLHYIEQAIQKLEEHVAITVKNISSIYETAPVGYLDQDAFLNGVVEISTTLTPHELLIETQRIEKELGRIREIVNGPRTVDLDILLYNQQNILSDDLQVPHPRMFLRGFVMIPLLDAGCDRHILEQFASRMGVEINTDLDGMTIYKKQLKFKVK